MSAKASTWMPFYVGDYLRDTGRLTTENHGAYLLLIFDYWTSRAPLPDDDDQLAAIVRLPLARWQKARRVIANYFTVADGVWRHKRIDAEIERANGISKARQEAGKRGGNAKAIATAEPEQTPKQNPTPSPSQSPSKEAATTARDPACDFIGIFDDVRTEVFGREQSRPWPEGSDLSTARKWMAAGVTPDLARAVLLARMRAMHAKGRRPPGTLTYFDAALMDALATSKQPLPEGNPNDDPLAIPDRFRRGPTKTDRAKAAVLRAAVAGGYAPEQPSGPAGTGDDNLSVFPVAQALRQGT